MLKGPVCRALHSVPRNPLFRMIFVKHSQQRKHLLKPQLERLERIFVLYWDLQVLCESSCFAALH